MNANANAKPNANARKQPLSLKEILSKVVDPHTTSPTTTPQNASAAYGKNNTDPGRGRGQNARLVTPRNSGQNAKPANPATSRQNAASNNPNNSANNARLANPATSRQNAAYNNTNNSANNAKLANSAPSRQRAAYNNTNNSANNANAANRRRSGNNNNNSAPQPYRELFPGADQAHKNNGQTEKSQDHQEQPTSTLKTKVDNFLKYLTRDG